MADVFSIVGSVLSIIVSIVALKRSGRALQQVQAINQRLSAPTTIHAAGNVHVVQQVQGGNVVMPGAMSADTTESAFPPLEATGGGG